MIKALLFDLGGTLHTVKRTEESKILFCRHLHELLASHGIKTDLSPEELGDLLFSVVNIARFAGVDAEQALTRSTDKFAKRFRAVEALAKERGIDMKNAPDSLIDSLWEEIK